MSPIPVELVDRALRLIARRKRERHFLGPRSLELVALAEEALGLQFPLSYRRFVSLLGAGSIGGFEVYGIIDAAFGDSGLPDAVWLTQRMRVEADLPESLILVGFDGMVSYYAIANGLGGSENEPPIIAVNPAFPVDPAACEVVAPSFGEFFLWGVERALALPSS